MATITEDYVSFEIAKLLREKGFGGECLSMYLTPKPRSGMGNPNEAKLAPHGRDSHYYEGYLYQCEAPTLQMAMKWLREEKRTTIIIEFDVTGRGFCPYVYQFDYDMDWVVKWRINIPMKYEEAVETALKYALENLI